MTRSDRHAEREWIDYMVERNERAARIAGIRRKRAPKKAQELTPMQWMLTALIVDVLAAGAIVVWVVR